MSEKKISPGLSDLQLMEDLRTESERVQMNGKNSDSWTQKIAEKNEADPAVIMAAEDEKNLQTQNKKTFAESVNHSAETHSHWQKQKSAQEVHQEMIDMILRKAEPDGVMKKGSVAATIHTQGADGQFQNKSAFQPETSELNQEPEERGEEQTSDHSNASLYTKLKQEAQNIKDKLDGVFAIKRHYRGLDKEKGGVEQQTTAEITKQNNKDQDLWDMKEQKEIADSLNKDHDTFNSSQMESFIHKKKRGRAVGGRGLGKMILNDKLAKKIASKDGKIDLPKGEKGSFVTRMKARKDHGFNEKGGGGMTL